MENAEKRIKEKKKKKTKCRKVCSDTTRTGSRSPHGPACISVPQVLFVPSADIRLFGTRCVMIVSASTPRQGTGKVRVNSMVRSYG